MIVMSLTPPEQFFVRIIPKNFTFYNYMVILSDPSHYRFYMNSWIIGICVSVITLIFGSIGAYGLSRFNFKLKNSFIMFILITQMLPGTLLLISYFKIVNKIGLYNTLLALIIVDSTRTIPFVTLMLKSIFDGIPREIDQSAMIDGCSRIGVFIKIVIPIARGGFFAGFIYAFLDAYGELLYGLTLTKDISAMPITVEMTWLLGRYLVSWERMIPLAILVSIPIFIIFAFSQDNLIKGLTAGSLKDV
jgi:multiple sugar transport system permease protein